jgi:chromosomal replication initiation ATPase DnaA
MFPRSIALVAIEEPRIEDIVTAVAKEYGITVDELLTHGRRRRERHVARYLARELTRLTMIEIAKATGRVTPQAVIYGVRKTVKDMQRDPLLRVRVERIKKALA